MAMISKCPRCMGIIQLDDNYTDPSMSMDCPRCKASFPLHEALDLMAEPLLEATAHGAAAKDTSTVGAAYGVQGATDSSGYGMQDNPNDTPVTETPANTDSTPAEQTSETPAETNGADSTPTDAPQSPDGFDFAGLDTSDPDANPFGSGESEFNVVGGADADETIASRAAARAADGPSMIGTMIGIFGGGFFGLFGGYYLLCFFGGGQYNFLKLNLPGISEKADDPQDDDIPQQVSAGDRSQFTVSTPPTGELENAFPESMQPEPEDPLIDPDLPDDDFNVPIKTPDPTDPVIPAPQKEPGTIVNAQAYSSDELGEQLKTVVDASGISDADNYEQLCVLAERFTHIDKTDASAKLQSRQAAVKKLIRNYAKSETQQTNLSSMAIDKFTTSGHDTSGIVITGLVESIDRPENGLVTITIQPAGSLESVTIAARTSLGVREGANALFIGVVVAKPEENLEGYVGLEYQVIYASAGSVLFN